MAEWRVQAHEEGGSGGLYSDRNDEGEYRHFRIEPNVNQPTIQTELMPLVAC